MIKFLHISDVHLGCRRYNLEERTKDFFRAWYEVVTRHAVPNRVDFVLIAGDFFDRRNIDPQTMNHAIAGLQILKDAQIPVVVIEGNHDRRDSVSPYSWMRSFSQAGLLMLLEPAKGEEGDAPIALAPWDEERREGTYVDIAGARIIGTHWYGTTTGVAVSLLADAIRQRRDPSLFHILMLHTDVEGQLSRPIPALPVEKLKELRAAVDYVALGHTHKRFEIDNWAFNPGSLEACSIDEAREERGVYLVEVDDERRVSATHIKDYFQRPFQRISFDVSGLETADAVREGVIEKLKLEARGASVDGAAKSEGVAAESGGEGASDGDERPAPIIEISLRGHLGFKNSLLELGRIREEARELTGALHVLVKNQSVPVEYAVAADLDPDVTRAERERRIVADLIARNNRWRGRADEMAELVLQAKKLALSDEAPAEILRHIEQHLARATDASADPKAQPAPAAADRNAETTPSPGALQAIERNAAVSNQLSAVSDD
ncbi:MAG TPA: exonuclease SbcCD subunit D [Pyrinomonadaceae bacterium]|nr:exonuclease SbcCD subunit D [Pyrinomonadaceae bacterium]